MAKRNCTTAADLAKLRDDDDYVPLVDWGEFAEFHLLYPLIVQIVILLLLFPASTLWEAKGWGQTRLFSKYVGTRLRPPEKARFLLSMHILELGFSLWAVIAWIYGTYARTLSLAERRNEQGLSVFFLVAYFVRLLQYEMGPSSCRDPACLINVCTVVPAFVEMGSHPHWLSLRFLRVYRVLDSFAEIERTGFLNAVVSDFNRAVMLMGLRAIAMILVLSGAIFTLEVLGEIPGLEDAPVETGMGPLSLVQMFYWMFTTISTVGYGDFSPTTIPSRLFCCVAIGVGVTFFTMQTSGLWELSLLLKNGKGTYSPRRTWRPVRRKKHVLIIGGGVKNPGDVLKALLGEIFSNDGRQWPDAVLMSTQKMSVELEHHAEHHVIPEARQQLHYFLGDPMSTVDLKRVKIADAEMVYVLADETAVDQEREDGHSIVRVLSVIKHNSNIKVCLMLLRPESKYQAINAGIPAEWCFSMNELLGNMLAACCHCHGIITFVTNLMDSSDVPVEQVGDEAWRGSYIASSNNAIYCTVVPSKYDGLTWAEFSFQFFNDTSHIVIATLKCGQIVLNAADRMLDKVQSREVCFIIADGQDCTADDSWIQEYHAQRDQGPSSAAFIGHTESGNPKDVRQDYADHIGHGFFHEEPSVRNGGLTKEKPAHSTVSAERPRRTHIRNIRALHAHLERNRHHKEVVKFDEEKELARRIVDTGGHTVVISSSPDHTNWEMMGSLLRQLRRVKFHWLRKKVVAMTPVNPPQWVTEAFPDVAFLCGLATCVMDLLELNLEHAEVVVILSGEDPVRHESHLQDHNVLLAANTLDLLLNDTDTKVFWIAEIHHSSSAALFPSVRIRPAQKEQAAERADITPSGVEKHWKEALRLNTRFASGQVFGLGFIGAMMGREYYCPSTIEVVEAMIMPHLRDQSCATWLVPCPAAFVGQPFRDLFAEWAKVNTKQNGVKNGENGHASGSPDGSRKNGNGSSAADEDKPAMPMGIYRTIFPEAVCGHARGMGYVIARPHPNLLLQEQDRIYVMASFEWASKNLLHSDNTEQEAQELKELNKLAELASPTPFDAEEAATCSEFGEPASAQDSPDSTAQSSPDKRFSPRS